MTERINCEECIYYVGNNICKLHAERIRNIIRCDSFKNKGDVE